MSTTASALLTILANATLVPDADADPGAEGGVVLKVVNSEGGRRWTQGTGSGQVDRIYRRERSMLAAATHSYNLLAAGTLSDVLGQAIDADELKAIVVRCVSGTIALEAPAANFLGFFLDAAGGIKLTAGQTLAIDLGAAGLDVTTDAKFDIIEKATAVASYELWLVVAQ